MHLLVTMELNVYSWLLEFYVLATSMVTSGWVLTCDSAHSWWLYSAALLGNQNVGTMTWYPHQSHYPDTDLTSSCPILMLSARLGSDKCKSSLKVTCLTRPQPEVPISHMPSPCSTDSAIMPGVYICTCAHMDIWIYWYIWIYMYIYGYVDIWSAAAGHSSQWHLVSQLEQHYEVIMSVHCHKMTLYVAQTWNPNKWAKMMAIDLAT